MSGFNKGDYVEIINLIKDTYLLGSRFHIGEEYIGKGVNIEKGKLYYYLPTNLSKRKSEIISPKYLKLVKFDDEQSDFTFNELLNNLSLVNTD